MQLKSFLGLTLIVILLTGCGSLMRVSGQSTPIPPQLLEPCERLVEAETLDDVLESHLINMERAGTCMARHGSLVEAIKAREAQDESD